MKYDVFGDLSASENIFENFKIEVESHFRGPLGTLKEAYGEKCWYCYLPEYQRYLSRIKNFVLLIKFLNLPGLAHHQVADLEKIPDKLNDHELTKKREAVIGNIDEIKRIVDVTKSHIDKKISTLSLFERERLCEAMHAYSDGCPNSCVAMAVSAIEFKLLKILKSKNPSRTEKMRRPTLGHVIDDYVSNKTEYLSVIPEKHEHLLNLCNTYRILAVHARPEKITQGIAESILNLTFAFLLDDALNEGIQN